MAKDITTAFLALILIPSALAAQIYGYMNYDNAWLLHVAERVNSGQKLGVDIIETNPPLIIYIMQIAVKFADLLNISHINGFIAFIALIGMASTLMSFANIKTASGRAAVIFGIFFLPQAVFGEREHIFVMLILPWFTSLWQPSKRYIIPFALIAGIGFCIKPFFALFWLFIIAAERKIFTVSNFIIGACLVFYAGYLLFIEPYYVSQIVPQLLKYYTAYATDTVATLKQVLPIAILCQLPFWITYIKDRAVLSRPIYFSIAANTAALLLVLIQNKPWALYNYPPFFFGFLTNMLLLAALRPRLKPLWNKAAAILAVLVLAALVFCAAVTNARIAMRYKQEDTARMISLFNQYATNKPVYALSFQLGSIFPAVVHSSAIYRGHYGHLWMLPRKGNNMQALDAIINDLATNPPALIVVAEEKYYSPAIGNYNFDFVEYFSRDQRFKTIWQNYAKIASFGQQAVYLRKNLDEKNK